MTKPKPRKRIAKVIDSSESDPKGPRGPAASGYVRKGGDQAREDKPKREGST